MSKEGSLHRIKVYEKAGNAALLEQEKAFYEEHYGKRDSKPVEEPQKEEAEEKPKKEKTKKSE